MCQWNCSMSFPSPLAWMYSGICLYVMQISRNICTLHWKILQEKGWVEDGYAQRTGFNELAKINDIVIMYPQVEDLVKTFDSLKANSYQIKHNLFYNPNGCWNFMGYLNDSDMYKFATKTGYQMRGVARMVEKVAGISMF